MRWFLQSIEMRFFLLWVLQEYIRYYSVCVAHFLSVYSYLIQEINEVLYFEQRKRRPWLIKLEICITTMAFI